MAGEASCWRVTIPRVSRVRSAGIALLAVAGGALLGAGDAAAAAPLARVAAVSCPAVPYPGDDAPREAIAAWMAGGATVAGLPGELPVMAGLVESGLRNLPEGQGDSDSAGYFQMRTSIWDAGAYAGYQTRPDLQLLWFTETAADVRADRLADGLPDPAADETAWGEWIADVERPAAQYRGRYQLRLTEARTLLGTSCAPGGGIAPAPPVGGPVPVAPGGDPTVPAAPADTTAPAARVTAARRQRALLRGLVTVDLRCPLEHCAASATVAVALPDGARPLRLSTRRVQLAAAQRTTLRIALGRRGWSTVRRALAERPSLRATVRVTVSDDAGNRTTQTRTVALVR